MEEVERKMAGAWLSKGDDIWHISHVLQGNGPALRITKRKQIIFM